MSTTSPTTPAPSPASRPTDPGQQVIVPHADRPLLGEIVATDPQPTIDDPDRVILTVAVDDELTIRALAKDAEVPTI